MAYLYSVLIQINTVTTALKNISSLSWQEIGAMLGVLTLIGGGFIKLIQRTDEKLKLRVDFLEADLKEKFKDCKEHIAEVEKRVIENSDKDSFNRDRAMEKIENRIEKLHDLIIKLIEKTT